MSKRKKPMTLTPAMKRSKSSPTPAMDDVETLKRELTVHKFQHRKISQKLVLEKRNTQREEGEKIRAMNRASSLQKALSALTTHWNLTLKDLEMALAQSGRTAPTPPDGELLSKLLGGDTKENMDGDLKQMLEAKREFSKRILALALSSWPAESKVNITAVQAKQRENQRTIETLKAEAEERKIKMKGLESKLEKANLDVQMAEKRSIRLGNDMKEVKLQLEDLRANPKISMTSSTPTAQTGTSNTGGKPSGPSGSDDDLVKKLEAKLHAVQEEVISLRKKVIDLQHQVREPKEEVVKQSGAYRTLHNQIFVLQENLKRARGDLSLVRKQEETLNTILSVERKRFREISQKMQSTLEQRIESLVAIRTQKERNIMDKQKDEIKTLQTELELAKKRVEELMGQEKKRSRDLESLKIDSDALVKITEGQQRWIYYIRAMEKKKKDLELKLKAFEDLKERASEAEKVSEELKLKEENSKLKEQISLLEKGELSEELETQKGLVEELEAELNDMGTSYEEMEEENRKLKDQVTEKDSTHFKMLQERMKVDAKLRKLFEELEILKSKETSQGIILTEKDKSHKALEELVDKQRKEAMEKDACLKSMAMQIEAFRRQAQSATQDADIKSKEHESSGKLISDLKKRLEDSERVRNKLDKEKIDISNKIQKYKRRLDGTVNKREMSDIEIQLEELQQKVICQLCSENQKNVIITRCFHCFCEKCIRKNLEVRNRNCPQCNKPYSKSDVKNLWI
ncbi:hypothetical protein AAMO2058_001178000 [Amorphochlora amoebiformis]|mmetsp:Transcript_28613/g.45586  ORF Transcript_28613/g.45586 Transcript_28613/m.45586 type:complete len:745 (-) Transcript_28613:83-2317(-)